MSKLTSRCRHNTSVGGEQSLTIQPSAAHLVQDEYRPSFGVSELLPSWTRSLRVCDSDLSAELRWLGVSISIS